MRTRHGIIATVVMLTLIGAWALGCSSAPTAAPAAPTVAVAPTEAPTVAPTVAPAPTEEPTSAPEPTEAPTVAPEPTEEPTEEPAAPAPTEEPAGETEPAEGETIDLEKEFAAFDPDNFDTSTQIDNPWLPFTPGTRYVYEGTSVEDDGTVLPHRIEINVTDLTKVIGGIPSVVTWDLDYSDDELVEAELAFFAQDNDGNVWRMGEYPEEYEEGEFVAAPAWIHGLEEAHAGIMMQADPQPGTPSYAQGWGPAVDWTDRGQVDQMGQETCVPVDCYEDALVIAETSAAEPDAEQLKFYARDVGNVRVGWRGAGEKTQEVLELVTLEQLTPEALAEVRAGALALEEHAYEVSQVYLETPPAE